MIANCKVRTFCGSKESIKINNLCSSTKIPSGSGQVHQQLRLRFRSSEIARLIEGGLLQDGDKVLDWDFGPSFSSEADINVTEVWSLARLTSGKYCSRGAGGASLLHSLLQGMRSLPLLLLIPCWLDQNGIFQSAWRRPQKGIFKKDTTLGWNFSFAFRCI